MVCTVVSLTCTSLRHARQYVCVVQVLFVCEKLQFGRVDLDQAASISFATAVSREEVSAKQGSAANEHDVYLVSAANLKVCSCRSCCAISNLIRACVL
jgi:hypothetical protein